MQPHIACVGTFNGKSGRQGLFRLKSGKVYKESSFLSMLMEAWVYGSEVTTPITLDNAVFVFVNTIYMDFNSFTS